MSFHWGQVARIPGLKSETPRQAPRQAGAGGAGWGTLRLLPTQRLPDPLPLPPENLTYNPGAGLPQSS